MSAPLKRNRTTPSKFVPVDASAGDRLNHHQYMAGSLPPGIRPAKWSMKAVMAELEAMAEDDQWDGNNRYVSLRSAESRARPESLAGSGAPMYENLLALRCDNRMAVPA